MASHAPRTSSDHPSHEQESPGLLTLTCGEQPEIDLEIKRSHFLARACRTDSTKEARDFIARVRSIHPDARHHCSAFTITDLTQGLEPLPHPTERSNDDGEPEQGDTGRGRTRRLSSATTSATPSRRSRTPLRPSSPQGSLTPAPAAPMTSSALLR